MKTQNNKIVLLLGVLIIQLVQCNCNNNYFNEFVSKLRLKRDYTIEDNTIQNLLPNMSFHSNLHNLPENAIYCTESINSDTERYGFLRKYYSAIQGKPNSYGYELECIYPKSLEFPSSPVEKPKTAVDKLNEALLMEAKNLKELLEKVERGEKAEPYKTMDINILADDIFDEIFNPKPDPLDYLESSAPYGVICEHLHFNETNEHGIVVDIKRPICYPAPRPQFTTTTTLPIMSKYPTVTTVTKSNDSKFVDKACHILCYTGLIYQLLPCCK
ncbi:uncharacterized protein LOC119614805 [Lucilia sericata]|uniref:uncharacterized protein LOC119614805 n=1 Tax=Lucilia sericata TaxID=13632 RepID=UPI0018A844CE|nr:uncharacterized protein LOC119614805 [Lucilia sericata]